MAITKAIPKIWSARLIAAFVAASVWRRLVMDGSSEVSGEGGSLSLSKITSTVTVRDYSKNTDIQAPEILTDGDEVLELNKKKYFNIFVDSVDRVQAKPDLLSAFTAQASQAMADQVDSDIRAAVLASLPVGQETAIESGVLAVKTATDANRKAVFDAVLGLIEKMDAAKWPVDRRWLVLNRRTRAMLTLHFIKEDLGTGILVDGLLSTGALSKSFGGMRVELDLNDTPSVVAGSVHAVAGLNEGTVFAQQIRNVQAYTPEKRFGDAVKGLWVYGSKRVRDDAIMSITEAV